mmetsp:Transcript_16451/g.25113  ORF Transcript_16451/g.25113 Transcript_16451/m.25113 type:complete len:123 (-) Transcript_16451:162-530(-)
MDDASDKRLTVGLWVKENHVSASTLTPLDIANILAKVTFSFEQGSVAKELAAGMNNAAASSGLQDQKKLTCDHILAAVYACPYAKADVAKAMASFVADPENKDEVLETLYSFERTSVERYFI